MAWIFPKRSRYSRVFIPKGLTLLVRNILEIPYNIRHWCRQIKRVAHYLPIIWKDVDWSAEPTCYKLLRKKLQLMEPVLRDGHLICGAHNAKEIRFAIRILDLLITDDYEDEAYRVHEAKWGSHEVWFINRFVKKNSHYYNNAHTAEEQKQAERELIDMVNAAQRKRQRHIEFVMQFLARHMPQWWD